MPVRVQEGDFDPGAELAALARGDEAGGETEVGGLASFVGLVRGTAGGRPIRAMTLEHYPGMTERKLAEIAAEAERRWPLTGTVIVHRVGRLLPGERIVLAAAASAHRAAALEACAFLIDWLKTEAPFWKFEEAEDGSGRWVEARDSDRAAAARWGGLGRG